MCPSWENSLETFILDMGPRPSKAYSVDRIDNSKGYFKENCRWATCREQSNNTDSNVRLSYNGKDLTIAQWAEEVGVEWNLFKRRVERLLSGKEAVEPRGQQIIQKTPLGDLISVYQSVQEASEKTLISQAAIRKCLCKHNKTSGGFLWEYYIT
jgi:hypothetical protein